MSKLFDWMQKQGSPMPVCVGCNLWHELDGCLRNIELTADSPVCRHFEPPIENPKCQDCVYFDNNTHDDTFGFLCIKLSWCQPDQPADECDYFRADCKECRDFANKLISREREEEKERSTNDNEQHTCAQCRWCVLCDSTPAEYKAAFCTIGKKRMNNLAFAITYDMRACEQFERKKYLER